MKLTDYKFFADENIQPDLIQFLRARNFNVVSVLSEGMIGCSDDEVNAYAYRNERVIITQDQDFGKLIYTTDIKFTGIIYLRPGHLNSNVHIKTLNTIFEKNPELNKSFLMVGENQNGTIKIRIRYPIG